MHTVRVKRRTFLSLSTVALLTQGCGLRVDTKPKLPTLSPTDTVRNQVARILAATEAQGDNAQIRDQLAQAVGPVWAPPTELATSAPTSVPTRSFEDSLDSIVTTVTGEFEALGGTTSGVLADVATGAALVLERDYPRGHPDIPQAFAYPRMLPPGTLTPATPGGNAQPLSVLTDLITVCYKGEYAYERLAVNTDPKSDYGTFVRNRIEAIAGAGEDALRLAVRAQVADLPANEPAWQLPGDPRKPQDLAAQAEDMIAQALAPVFAIEDAGQTNVVADVHTFALYQLYLSAQARARAGKFELLRFA